MPGTETEFDKSARVRDDLGLPAVFRLIADHRVLCALVPNAGRFAIEIMLTNKRRLNLPGALGTDDRCPRRLRAAEAACLRLTATECTWFLGETAAGRTFARSTEAWGFLRTRCADGSGAPLSRLASAEAALTKKRIAQTVKRTAFRKAIDGKAAFERK